MVARRRITWPASWLSVLLVACGGGSGGGGLTVATLGAGSSGGPSTSTDTDDPGTGSDEDEDGEESTSDGPEPMECGELVQCGATCADLQTDPNNCGDCGISCVIANAEPTCTAGECGLGSCLPGFSDCDGDLATGCEAMAECGAGAPCMTTCGSMGTTACSATCEPVCEVMVESCNAVDDDCNTMCDEGPIAGCRIGVHRSNHASLGHFYTIDLTEAQSNGYVLEAQDFFFLYTAATDGLVALNRCLRPSGAHFYTASATCEDAGVNEGALGYMSPDERCGGIALYRLYNSGSGTHFYTTSAAERDTAVAGGWLYEAVAGYVWAGA
jgi:hypothetical protein